jgi:hypothetical protein
MTGHTDYSFWTIWLEPTCPECDQRYATEGEDARCWSNERLSDCDECGRSWVRYDLSPDQPVLEYEATYMESEDVHKQS